MLLESNARNLAQVTLPPWAGRDRYMHTFDTAAPVMAPGFEDYLPAVTKLWRAAGVAGTAHMTVDEAVVPAGMSQRRPGPHVDGCFVPALRRWTHGGSSGGWLHYCNNVPGGRIARMAVIVAASVAACRVWEGRFEGEPAQDGDLEHIRDQLGGCRLLAAGRGWLLSPDCVHESVRFVRPTRRTFLRIAFEREALRTA